MPPKVKTNKEDVISTALDLLREKGKTAINARSVAKRLKCSTQPIFSNFSSMDELQEEVTKKAYEIYLDFLKREEESKKYPIYKSYGMAYVSFAKEEKELFKYLFMRDRTGKDTSPTSDFNKSVDIIVQTLGIEREKAEFFHLEVWTFVHGVATMLATSFLNLENDVISNMLTDVYMGLKSIYCNKE